jgi:hypothetical protein
MYQATRYILYDCKICAPDACRGHDPSELPQPTITVVPAAVLPYVCPLCGGTGQTHNQTGCGTADTMFVTCHPCGGKGLVWGPPA